DHGIEAHGDHVTDALVHVHRGAIIVVGSDTGLDGPLIVGQRLLGDEIDGAAHRTAPAEHRIGAVGDFHLLDIVGLIAVHDRTAANAIDRDVVIGGITAQRDPI